MKTLMIFSLFIAFFFSLPEAKSRDRDQLYLKGEVPFYTSIDQASDNFFIKSNGRSGIVVGLNHKKGRRAPASILTEQELVLKSADLKDSGVEIIEVKAP